MSVSNYVQVPPELLDENGAAWNKGHVWIPGDGRSAVPEAYAKQSQEDVRKFLRCRAEEMRRDGVLFILSLCRACDDRRQSNNYGRVRDFWKAYFEWTWNELVEEVSSCMINSNYCKLKENIKSKTIMTLGDRESEMASVCTFWTGNC